MTGSSRRRSLVTISESQCSQLASKLDVSSSEVGVASAVSLPAALSIVASHTFHSGSSPLGLQRLVTLAALAKGNKPLSPVQCEGHVTSVKEGHVSVSKACFKRRQELHTHTVNELLWQEFILTRPATVAMSVFRCAHLKTHGMLA